jgi:hypothetical protein
MISQLQQDVVQGPIEHPEYGRTILIHPTIETARAGRFPTQAVVVTAAARTLIALAKEGDRVKTIIVEGEEHDPTKHPEFSEISLNLRELVNKHFPKADFKLFSDAPHLEESNTRHALVYYDHPTLRLEAGFQKTFCAMTGEDGKVFKDRVEFMNRLELEKLIVRASFVRGSIDNSKDKEVNAWIKLLVDIRPAMVHISTPAKAPDKKTKPITATRLSEIAEMVTEKSGLAVEVVPG